MPWTDPEEVGAAGFTTSPAAPGGFRTPFPGMSPFACRGADAPIGSVDVEAPELSRDDDIVAARLDVFFFRELGRARERLADMDELAVPPHLLGGPAAAHPRPQPLDQLLAVHRPSGSVLRPWPSPAAAARRGRRQPVTARGIASVA